MQEKTQKISPIKQRILDFADSLGISKREFYSRIGVSRGTLEAKTGITEDILAKFIAMYPDVSIEWLMTGEGEMIRHMQKVGDVNDSSLTGVNVYGTDININPDAYNTLLEIVRTNQRSAEKFQESTAKFQEQIDRLLKIIEDKK